MFRDKLAVLQTLAATVNRVSSSVDNGRRFSCPPLAVALRHERKMGLLQLVFSRFSLLLNTICCVLKPRSSDESELQLPAKAAIL